jgi:hypothetical protein
MELDRIPSLPEFKLEVAFGFWYTMARNPDGVVIHGLDSSHKSLPSSWLATAGLAEPHCSARHLVMFLFSYIRRQTFERQLEG